MKLQLSNFVQVPTVNSQVLLDHRQISYKTLSLEFDFAGWENSSEKIQGSGAMEGTAKVLAALAHVIALDRGWFGHGWEWPSWLMLFLLVDGEMKKQL